MFTDIDVELIKTVKEITASRGADTFINIIGKTVARQYGLIQRAA